MRGKCERCGALLSGYNPGRLCYACQKKRIEEMTSAYDELQYYDVEDVAEILGLRSGESVKRLARKDKLPPRVPAIRKYLWRKKAIDKWIESGHKVSPRTDEEDKAMKLALKKGVPIEQITLYGHYPQGLIEWYREWKHLDDTETQSK